MVDIKMIDKAVMAHKEWKDKLENAINAGRSDLNPLVVKTDNACEFGKWLYSLSAADKANVTFNTIKELHAEFHKIAGDILQLAVNGQKEDAIKKLSFGGTYGIASSKLTTALYEWKKKL